MNPINTNQRILELYSGRRNRNIYPNPSSFVVPFAPTVHKQHCDEEKTIFDPVCKGAIYYTFSWLPQAEIPFDNRQFVNFVSGRFDIGTTQSKPVLKFNTNNQTYLPFNYPNYLVGFKIYEYRNYTITNSEFRYITSWDPSTNIVTLNRPFNQPLQILNFDYGFAIFTILPNTWSIYLPTVDDNRIVINKTPLYYNGYYVVFESQYDYSNSTNSNIFSRRISYYDSESQIAYFDEPIPYDYKNNTPRVYQTWTLRKSLPLERWVLNKTTYYKSTKAINPVTGPLPGYIITLPDEASSIDNYYKGKYVYVVSNPALSYSPPLPPINQILPIDGSFYPVYGLFYIRAYNGSTKELSIESIQNKFNADVYTSTCVLCDTGNLSPIPNYIPLNLNSSSLVAGEGFISPTIPINQNEGIYRVYANIFDQHFIDIYNTFTLKLNLQRSKTYKIYFVVKQNPFLTQSSILTTLGTTVDTRVDQTFQTIGGPDYTYYTLFITMQPDKNNDILKFVFLYYNFNNETNIEDIWYEWKFLEVYQYDTINIVELEYDNYSPLDYNGSIVSSDQNVCYEMSIINLTLPNKELLTGSSIAFYPFVYVEIENATNVSTAPNTIISNNPPSTKAVFTVPIPQVNNPEVQKFVTLTESDTQIVKFKPNDSIKFSVYLPNGKPFQTLLPDILSPYSPDPSLQIQAVFNLVRLNTINFDE